MVDTNIFFDKNQSSELLKALLKKKTATDVIKTWNKNYLKPVYGLFAKGNLDSLGHIQTYAALGKVCAIVFHHLTQLEDNRAYIAAETIRDTTISETYRYTNLSKEKAAILVDKSWCNLKENFLENEKLTLEEAADLGIKELIYNNKEDIKLILETDGKKYINPINLEANKGETLNTEKPEEVKLHEQDKDPNISNQKIEVELPKEEQEPDYFNEVEALVEATEKEIEKTTPIAWGSIASYLGAPPDEEDKMFASGAWCIPNRVVTCIPAGSSVGKSFYALELSMALATGTNFFKPWLPSRPTGVAYITAEDPEEQLWKRIYYINQTFTDLQKNRDLLIENFHVHSIQGQVARLMQQDGHTKNNVEAPFYRILDNAIGDLKIINPSLQLVFLDTLSRFFGGNENDNQSGADFVSLLEKLCAKHNIAIAVLCHTAKSNTKGGSIEDVTARGASSFEANARYAIRLQQLAEEKTKDYKIPQEDFVKYVEVRPGSVNYVQKEGSSQWYKRNQWGVLVPTFIQSAANEENKELIKETIIEYYEYEDEKQKEDIYDYNPIMYSQITSGFKDRYNKGAKSFHNAITKYKITNKQLKYCLEELEKGLEIKRIKVRNYYNNKGLEIIIPWDKEIEAYFTNPNYRYKNKEKDKKSKNPAEG